MHIFTLTGPLTFDSVLALAHQGKTWLSQDSEITVNLQDIKAADSAGLALLIDWMREAKRQNKKIVFTHVPSQLLSLAKVAGVEGFLQGK